MVVALFALFGMLDDIVNIGRPAKLILIYYCAYPLIPFIAATAITVPLVGEVDLSLIYIQLIVPTYVPVVANLVNMHSGFNGLAPALSLSFSLRSFSRRSCSEIFSMHSSLSALQAPCWSSSSSKTTLSGYSGAISVPCLSALPSGR